MKKLKNRKELKEQLIDLLKNFDINCNGYNTDIYAYYDDETSIADLRRFEYVGYNQYIQDNHYTIYTDTEHFEHNMRYTSIFNSIKDLSVALDKSEKDLYKETGSDDFYDVINYCLENYYTELIDVYIEFFVNENEEWYENKAEEILNNFEEML